MTRSLEKEFAKALEHKLTDADIERARLLLGLDAPIRNRELFSVATPDAIRNWAMGVGDDNPLYIDEEYGPTTRWGSQIAHGTMVGHVKTPMQGRPDSRRRSRSRPRACSVEFTCSCPAARGSGIGPCTPVTGSSRSKGQESLEVKASSFADRSVIRVLRTVAINQRAEVVGVYRILTVNTARKESREKGQVRVDRACALHRRGLRAHRRHLRTRGPARR